MLYLREGEGIRLSQGQASRPRVEPGSILQAMWQSHPSFQVEMQAFLSPSPM